MVDQTILSTIRQYIQALENHGLPVTKVVLFGSQVTGNVHEWSDIDLLVISKRFDEESPIAHINLLWHTTLEVDNRIEPIACGEQQWQEDDFTPILEVARREGIVIEPRAELA
jgi:predicted nucleotidyltransferase